MKNIYRAVALSFLIAAISFAQTPTGTTNTKGGGGGGSGTVNNSGTAGAFACYLTTGTAVSACPSITQDGSGNETATSVTTGIGGFNTSGFYGFAAALSCSGQTGFYAPAGGTIGGCAGGTETWSSNNSGYNTYVNTTIGGALLATNYGVFLHPRVITASGAITVTAGDQTVCVNKTTGAASAVALEASPITGHLLFVKDCKGDASTNNITITPNAGNIDGSATYVINTAYGGVQLMYTGSQWNTLAKF